MNRFLRSLYALWKVKETFPKSPGLYLAYNFNRIFAFSEDFNDPQDSYLGYREMWGNNAPFYSNPDELVQAFIKYLVDFTAHLSNGNLENVSILELPSFGAMIDSLENDDCNTMPWSTQLNMAIYNKIKVINYDLVLNKISNNINKSYTCLISVPKIF